MKKLVIKDSLKCQDDTSKVGTELMVTQSQGNPNLIWEENIWKGLCKKQLNQSVLTSS